MTWISKILGLLPGTIIEQLYNSRFGKTLVSLYELLNRNTSVNVYKVQNLALMELDVSKPGERGVSVGAFEPNITRRFLNNVKEGDVIFDVGSWIGYYALLSAPAAERVVAIEADPINCDRIRKNIELNGFNNIQLLNVAIGDDESQGSILKGPGSLMQKVIREGGAQTIPIRTLDNVISELQIKKIHVLVMDIEGFEYYAIEGLSHSLLNKVVDKIICEVHPKMLAQEGFSDELVIETLQNKGYSVEIIDKHDDQRAYHIEANLNS